MDLRAVIFMPALAASVILGFVFLTFAARYYLDVLEGTAAGAKEITWQPTDITESFGRFCYLAWLVGLWFGPAYIIGRVAVGGGSPWTTLYIPIAVLWVCYPISQLSSLSASTPWMPLVPDVFVRLARKPFVVFQFFVLSAAVLAVLGVAFRWTFQLTGQWEYLFAGAPLLVLSGFLYARLIGRLAFVLRFTKGLFSTRRKKAKVEKEPEEKPEAPKPKRKQPRDMAPVVTPEGELGGYDVKFEDEPEPTPKKRVRAEIAEPDPEPPAPESFPEEHPRRRSAPDGAVERNRVWTDEDDEEATAYGVREAEVKSSDGVPREVPEATADEMKLLSRDDAPKKPKRPWGPELLAFLAQEGTVSAIVIASGLCVLAGAMVRVARAFNPVAGGE